MITIYNWHEPTTSLSRCKPIECNNTMSLARSFSQIGKAKLDSSIVSITLKDENTGKTIRIEFDNEARKKILEWFNIEQEIAKARV